MAEVYGNGHLRARINEAGRWVDLDALTTGQKAPEVRPTPFEWDIYEAMENVPVPLDADWGIYTDEDVRHHIPQAEDVIRIRRGVSKTVPGYDMASEPRAFDPRPATLRFEASDAHAEFSGQAGTPPQDVYVG